MTNACLWCQGKADPGKKYCSRSHGQMYWASKHPLYQQKQRKSKKKFRLKTINKNLTFIVAAMMVENDQDLWKS